MSERVKRDLGMVVVGAVGTTAGYCVEAALGRGLTQSLVDTSDGYTATPVVLPSGALVNQDLSTLLPTVGENVVFPTSWPTFTRVPTDTPRPPTATRSREFVGTDIILSVMPGNSDVKFAVIEGGMRVSDQKLTKEETVMFAFIINGDNSGNSRFDNEALNLARDAMVAAGLPNDVRIDIPNLEMVPTVPGSKVVVDGVEHTVIGDVAAREQIGGYEIQIYKTRADVSRKQQVAIAGSPGKKYSFPSSGMRNGELVDLAQITDLRTGQTIYIAARDLCGNTIATVITAHEVHMDTLTPVNTSTPFDTVTPGVIFTSTNTMTPSLTNTFPPGFTPSATFVPTATKEVSPTSSDVPTNTDVFVPTETGNPPTETKVPITNTFVPSSTPSPAFTNTHEPTSVPTETPNPPTETNVPIPSDTPVSNNPAPTNTDTAADTEVPQLDTETPVPIVRSGGTLSMVSYGERFKDYNSVVGESVIDSHLQVKGDSDKLAQLSILPIIILAGLNFADNHNIVGRLRKRFRK